MFDALRKTLNKFSKEASEDAAKSAPPPAKAPPAPAKAPGEPTKAATKPTAEFEVVRRAPAAAPAKPAAPAPKPAEAAKPAPAVPAPKPATPAPKPAEPAKPAPAQSAPAVSSTPAYTTPEAKRAEAERFDRVITEATEPAAPATPQRFAEGVEGADVEEARLPAIGSGGPRPGDRPGLQQSERREPAAVAKPVPSAPTAGGKAIKVEKLEDLLWDLELSLLESDVALPVVEKIKESLKEQIPRIRVEREDEIGPKVEAALRQALLDVLSFKTIEFDEFVMDKLAEKKPVVLMFVGVNGTGKTTAIGRIAHRLKENGFGSVMAAGDTFRAGAIAQLERHGENLGITVIKHQSGGDPAAVAYDAVEHAKARMKDVVLLDTAGRMQTNTNLMDEMKKIKRVAKPDMIIFVGDSLAGNDAVEQAVKFDEAVGIDAVILTKVDTDAKGGAALSIAQAVGRPILFLGVGQEYGDLIPYDANWMVDRIFEEA